MIDYIVLDTETKKLFSELEKNDPRLLELSYVGIYRSDTDTYQGFFENELKDLWPLLESANLIIGFNIIKFDYPVLSPYYPGDLQKLPTLDILDRVKESLGFRVGLDTIARATLGMSKTGTGFEAIEYFKNGQLKELAEYCLHDVKITKEIFEYARENKILKYYDLNQIREFSINIETVAESTADIQMSLGV